MPPAISHDQALSLTPARRNAIEGLYGALASGSFDALDEVLTADWEDIPLGAGQGPGPGGLKPVFAMLREAFPDIAVEISAVLAESDRIACRVCVTGTHRGDLFGVPASGKPIRFALHEFHEFAGDCIRRSFHMEDLFGLFMQIGRWPAIPQAPG